MIQYSWSNSSKSTSSNFPQYKAVPRVAAYRWFTRRRLRIVVEVAVSAADSRRPQSVAWISFGPFCSCMHRSTRPGRYSGHELGLLFSFFFVPLFFCPVSSFQPVRLSIFMSICFRRGTVPWNNRKKDCHPLVNLPCSPMCELIARIYFLRVEMLTKWTCMSIPIQKCVKNSKFD